MGEKSGRILLLIGKYPSGLGYHVHSMDYFSGTLKNAYSSCSQYPAFLLIERNGGPAYAASGMLDNGSGREEISFSGRYHTVMLGFNRQQALDEQGFCAEDYFAALSAFGEFKKRYGSNSMP